MSSTLPAEMEQKTALRRFRPIPGESSTNRTLAQSCGPLTPISRGMILG